MAKEICLWPRIVLAVYILHLWVSLSTQQPAAKQSEDSKPDEGTKLLEDKADDEESDMEGGMFDLFG